MGEVGRAVVVPVAGASVELADLVEHCAPRLAKYKIPKSVVVVDALPRNVLARCRSRSSVRSSAALAGTTPRTSADGLNPGSVSGGRVNSSAGDMRLRAR